MPRWWGGFPGCTLRSGNSMNASSLSLRSGALEPDPGAIGDPLDLAPAGGSLTRPARNARSAWLAPKNGGGDQYLVKDLILCCCLWFWRTVVRAGFAARGGWRCGSWMDRWIFGTDERSLPVPILLAPLGTNDGSHIRRCTLMHIDVMPNPHPGPLCWRSDPKMA
jgi:hypothetical protein